MTNNSGISKAISFSVVLIGIAVFYYFVIFLPKQEQARVDLQKQEQETQRQEVQIKKDALDTCLSDAEKLQESGNVLLFKRYDECEKRGGGICSAGTAEGITQVLDKNNADLQKDKDNCFKQYPQK